jgi:alpha-glucosidase
VEAQDAEPGSVLAMCRRALAARRRLRASALTGPGDEVRWSVTGGLLAAERAGRLTVLVNLGDAPAPMPAGRSLVASGPFAGDGSLPPDTAAWVLRE